MAAFLVCGSLSAADVFDTGNTTAEAAAKAVNIDTAGLGISTPGWADFLPLSTQTPPSQKITFSFNSVLAESHDPASKEIPKEGNLTEEEPTESTPLPTITPLKKQVVMHPTVYTTHRTVPVVNAENVLFHANLAYLTAVNVADYFSTRTALQYEELYEANPLMRPFVGNDLAFAAAKLGLTAGSVFLMKSLYKKNKPLAWAATIVANLAVSYVVVNNLRAIDMVKAQQRSFGQ